MSLDVILFDLDGTLSDSAPGILGALQLAFAENGVGWVDDQTARSLLGPPFWHSLPPLVGAAKLESVVAAYRRHYVGQEMMFDTRVYDGMPELLTELAEYGHRMAVATSKPEPHSARIVARLGLADYFEFVCGDTVDGQRDTKALVIGEALARLGQPDPRQVLMVGDRSHDVLGAAAHGIGCAGVLWGYGSRAELAAAGARALCERPGQVAELIRAAA